MDDEIENNGTTQIIDAMNNDSLIIFVGAGVSANSNLPKWSELIADMKKDLSIKDEDDYLKIAQYYFDTFGKQTYFSKLTDMFNRQSVVKPNEIHDHIKKIRPKHIITTNYDTLLEESLNSGMSKYDKITSDDDIPYSKSKHYLIKMHGDFSKMNIVFKEDDYLDYESNFSMVSTLIKSLIMNNTILFLGYSLNDSTFNSIFRLIHNSFGENAKKAYFFTPKTPQNSVIEYYKRKGIYVLSDNKNVIEKDFGKSTLNFISKVSGKNKIKATNQDQLWEKIKFLNQLSFVDSTDIAEVSTLNGKAIFRFPEQYEWVMSDGNKKNVFNISTDSNIIDFIKEKTMIENFLGITIEERNGFKKNEVLKPAFDLYNDHKYTEAKNEFRKIANKAYSTKDYTNFLIAEFNIAHIGVNLYDSPIGMEEPIYGDDEFSDVLDGIINYSNQNNKKITVYLKENIFNFKFLYRKMYKIIDLLDELKKEHRTYHNGGSYYTNNLNILQYEFKSLIQFIDLNCICVKQYKEFKKIVSMYFEGLLLALDNSSVKFNGMTTLFGKTSSIINLIEDEDINDTVPYIDYETLEVCLNTYSIDKIKISDDAFDSLIDRIVRLCDLLKKATILDNNYSMLNHYIEFLSYIKLNNVKDLIKILDNYEILANINNSKSIELIVKLLVQNKDKIIEDESCKELNNIMESQLETIISNKYDSQYSNFYGYGMLFEFLSKKENFKEIFVPSFEEKIVVIDTIDDNLTDIEKYEPFITSFYDYMNKNDKKIIDEILDKYSKRTLKSGVLNIAFLSRLIENNINSFDDLKEMIFKKLILDVEFEENSNFESYPSKRNQAIAYLFQLVEIGYFEKKQIYEAGIDERLEGFFPEVDWVLLDKRDNNTISGLIENRDFSSAKSQFCKNDNDKELFDRWAIRQMESGEIKA